MAGILADIKSALGNNVDEIDGPILTTQQEAQGTDENSTEKESIGQSKKPVRQWTREDVQDWLKDNELTKLCETFKTCKGRHLEVMHSKYSDDKNAFYGELKTDYNMNGKTCTDFVVALEEACED
ncbi:uncharacterized protein [Amphiura filiformis]|uniref:uncharacterized protein n=1 Tax=Amphiura filiformis TaxID=82378 RepID=UPI003B20B8BB